MNDPKALATTTLTNEHDGRRDFDFLFGRWTVANHKLINPLDPGSADWTEFESYVETQPILNGLGNIDQYFAPEFPNRPGFEAIALRLFDSRSRAWRIWWASTASSGQLDTPVEGTFRGEHGVFECDDVLNGQELRVRYEWLDATSKSPRWQQSFSFDGGTTWVPNWIMRWRRTMDPLA
jgi:hypothetical protein